MERETGIGPATNSLEGCDSTIELLPPKTKKRSQFDYINRVILSRRQRAGQDFAGFIHVLLRNDIRR